MAIDLENKNIYLPRLFRIMEIIPETSDIKTFRLDLEGENSSHLPGQFAELFVPGVGEAPISITSSPTQKGILEFSIKRTGLVTSAIHRLNSNDRLGIRGPYGNTFPISDLTGQNLLFIAGGIGLAPLRSLINYVLDTEKRNQFKKVIILYGARSPQDLVFKWELKKWQMRDDITFLLTVDRGDDQWKSTVGLVPNVLKENIQVNPLEWKSIICGPPIMIKFTIKALLEMGFQPPDIITTLEMRMKCGLGKCGRCNIGPYYVCKDGPVFTYQQLQNIPEEY
ncbi:FAD/NAD(P)-binding protein [Atribacter laminatus]|uniref:Anaerobic sulfite reductase subunit B n=1 Tax=Atribacter laminatus TaxID=2847778 RepID=A0A7T1AN28_ATRLM|nr:FAD/NAD(P)-binding protein [Atribacter laminatus]QPM68949.1 Anaerobic sulfite reductase subunit B [Atribacter laminatus]